MRFPIYFLIFARSKLCCSAKSFLDSKSAPQLVPLVTDLFSWILRRKKNPILWKSSIITVFHEAGSKALVHKTDQSAYFFLLVFERFVFENLFPIVRPPFVCGQDGLISKGSTVGQLIGYLDLVYTARDHNVPCLAS